MCFLKYAGVVFLLHLSWDGRQQDPRRILGICISAGLFERKFKIWWVLLGNEREVFGLRGVFDKVV